MNLLDILYEDCKSCQKRLFEYSDKTIKDTIERWKQDTPNIEDNQAKQLIQRFDQVKAGLKNKLDILVLPDDLKKGYNYLDIDKYSYNDMVNLINSIPENPDKIKKEAINKFTKQGIDKPLAQSYVARFLNKKENLKYAVEHGTEDGNFSKKEVLEFIPKYLLQKEMYLDPRNWRWENFEQMLDALFPREYKETENENNADTNADKVFDNGIIEIYRGDDVNKCISYNPTLSTKQKKYGWCVTQPGNTNYDYYRFEDREPTFYIVFDRSKPSTPNQAPFDDQWHAFVIQVNKDGKSYVVTGANNRADNKVNSWEEINNIVPPETWENIKNLKEYFKPIGLSPVELGRKFAAGKNLSVEQFKELNQDNKILYIQGKASKNSLTNDILKILPKYKISYEGRSTTLANIAIDNGQEFSWNQLKDYESLAKRYAIFRFRHTNYSKTPIPLPFIKFLDNESRLKYFKTFPKTLKFEYVEKYFGSEIAKIYVEDLISKLEYLPYSSLSYIPKEYKSLYEILFKFQQNWKEDDPDEEDIQSSPDLFVNPIRINLDQFKNISKDERNKIIDIYIKNPNNINIKSSLPLIGQNNNQIFYFLPKEISEYSMEGAWVMIDNNNKIIKEFNIEDLTINNEPATYIDENTNIIQPLSNFKLNNKNIKLNEFIYERHKLQYKAGIIK